VENAVALMLAAREHPEAMDALLARAGRVKDEVFGRSVKLFVPIYLSNDCVNDCVYCAYRSGHLAMPRRTLSGEALSREIEKVIGMGYRVLELVTSESPELKAGGKLAEAVSVTRHLVDSADQASEKSEVILMSWVLSDEEFAQVKSAGCDAFYLWQETYDRELFKGLHPVWTPKADFDRRTSVFDRAIRAGIRKVGLGVLFGLGPWEFDVAALIAHGKYLEQSYGVKIDAIGIPRFKPASGAPLTEAPYPVSDGELKIAVALYRQIGRAHV
jgi:2-iminoacetate synthase